MNRLSIAAIAAVSLAILGLAATQHAQAFWSGGYCSEAPGGCSSVAWCSYDGTNCHWPNAGYLQPQVSNVWWGGGWNGGGWYGCHHFWNPPCCGGWNGGGYNNYNDNQQQQSQQQSVVINIPSLGQILGNGLGNGY